SERADYNIFQGVVAQTLDWLRSFKPSTLNPIGWPAKVYCSGLGVKRLYCRYSMSTFVLDTYEQSIRSWIPQSGHTRDSWRYTLHYRSPFPFTDWGRFEFQEH